MQQPDLADATYWGKRQHGVVPIAPSDPDWLPLVAPFLRGKSGCRFLEVGCSPGHVSASLVRAFGFQAEGVDFSPEAHLFLESMASVGCHGAVLHRADLRCFSPERRYEIVSSFGLVEHFRDFDSILDHHDRLLMPGGLCLIVVPNFRGVQWLYHRLFDARDLRCHNLDVMDPNVFQRFAKRHGHKVMVLAHAGRIAFWNVDLEGRLPMVLTRRVLSRFARGVASQIGHWLPLASPLWSPWLVYLGRKPE